MKYRIGLTQMIYEEATVTVEADSRDEAEAKALAMVDNGEGPWRFCAIAGPPEVVTVELTR